MSTSSRVAFARLTSKLPPAGSRMPWVPSAWVMPKTVAARPRTSMLRVAAVRVTVPLPAAAWAGRSSPAGAAARSVPAARMPRLVSVIWVPVPWPGLPPGLRRSIDQSSMAHPHAADVTPP